jgi:hypothetical protein
MVKGKENLATPDDLQPAMGLDLVLPASGRFLSGFLKGINPFSVWGIILTAIGISVTHKQSKGTAYTAAILSSLFILVIFAVLGATCTPRAPAEGYTVALVRLMTPASSRAAWAAARRAIGTRNGEHET